MRDDDLGQAEFALDARLCLNVSADWTPDNGGQVVYIARSVAVVDFIRLLNSF